MSDKAIKLSQAKTLYDDLRGRVEDQIIVSSTEPQETNNELWINNDPQQEITIPTYAELQTLSGAINGKQDAPETAGTAGQVLSLDNNLDPVWTTPQSGGGVSDVQVNGTSVVTNGVANVPVGSSSDYGVYMVSNSLGINVTNGKLQVVNASSANIKAGSDGYKPITSNRVNEATFYGLAKSAGNSDQSSSNNSVGVYTEDAKSKISDMLSAPETVSGTTPSITAKAGVRYICGEVATLTIVVPASGIIDVTFDSGSTPTVLTVTPPTGMTMRWIGDDPTALEANKTYEVNIMDGCYGMVISWT